MSFVLSFGDVARRPQIRTLARLEASVFGPSETSGAVLVSARNDAAYLQLEWYRVSCLVVCEGRIEKEECGSCGSRLGPSLCVQFQTPKSLLCSQIRSARLWLSTSIRSLDVGLEITPRRHNR